MFLVIEKHLTLAEKKIMPKLYKHQQDFLDSGQEQALLCWECGSGKTLAAVEFMKQRPHISFLTICPKQIKKMWLDVAPENAVIVTKEEFKKYTLPFEGVVVDECDYFLSPLFTKGRSAMATALYNWIRLHPTAPVLLMSATIIKNAPHSSHTALTYIQRAISWKAYRALQYNLVSRPYNPRPFYEPKKGWQKVSAKMITANASIVDMSDIVTVPEQFEQVVRLYRV